jgi:nitroimidazol reductase NimA-like FMN-containing flavoprotein (pyridoxamine 5'-phosphate oxidase superfamily)
VHHGGMPSTRVTRLRELQVGERAALDALLDHVQVGHIGFNADDHPVVIPTAVARQGDVALVHGSTGSRWMRTVADGGPACLTVTSIDGVMVARSAFESSFHYRSAVIFGRFVRLEGDRKQRALDALVEKLIPGRSAEVRPSSPGELNKTMVLALPIAEWSLKVSDGWPDDGDEDVAGPAWAGVVPLAQRAGAPRPAPNLRAGIPVPPSVRAFTDF